MEGYLDFDCLELEQMEEMDGTQMDTWRELMNTLRVAFNLDPGLEVKKVIRNLDKAMRNCHYCHAMLEEIEQQQGGVICPIPIQKTSMADTAKAGEKELLKGTKSMAGLVMKQDWVEQGTRTEEEEEEDEVAGGDKANGKGHGAFVVGDWTQAWIGRFPRPKTGPDMPMISSLRGRQLPFQKHFDDYYNGPTLTDLQPVPQSIMGYDASLVYLANRMTIMPWTLFKDYGYTEFCTEF